MSDQPQPTGEWTVEPVKRSDGTGWSGLASVVEPDGTKHGAMNDQVAQRLVKIINAVLAATGEWTEGRVFAYFESEDFKGLADAINAALAAEREISSSLGKLNATVHQHLTQCGEQLSAEREKVQTLVDAMKLALTTEGNARQVLKDALAKVGK